MHRNVSCAETSIPSPDVAGPFPLQLMSNSSTQTLACASGFQGLDIPP